MIESMTGFGDAVLVEDGVSYSFEARSVNHRYLKVSVKLPDAVQFAESAVEEVVRGRLARGSVTCTLRVRSESGGDLAPISVAALQQYVDRLAAVHMPADLKATVDLAVLAAMPGVCGADEQDEETRRNLTARIAKLAESAMDSLVTMRRDEGRALHAALMECCGALRSELAEVTSRAPAVVEDYHQRLSARVEVLMRGQCLDLEKEGLLREVAIFAERSDITEEATRMSSHLDQFLELCDKGQRVGRTLDFLAQELLREANTIASKCNDAAIARAMVRVKGTIDRIKEQVQNVE